LNKKIVRGKAGNFAPYSLHSVLFLFITLAGVADAVKPANISDIAGDYKLMNVTGVEFCTATMHLSTAANQLTAMEFKDFPIKCNLPWKLEVYDEPAANKRSSTIGSHVSAPDHFKKCSGTVVRFFAFRALRDHEHALESYQRNSTWILVQKGRYYFELHVWSDGGLLGRCIYERYANSRNLTAPADEPVFELESNATETVTSGSSGGSTTNEKFEGPWVWLGPVLGSTATIIAALITVYCVKSSQEKKESTKRSSNDGASREDSKCSSSGRTSTKGVGSESPRLEPR